VPGAQIIVLSSHGHNWPRARIGEIWIQALVLIKGYWNIHQRRREILTAASGIPRSRLRFRFCKISSRVRTIAPKDNHHRAGLKDLFPESIRVLSAVGHPRLGERDHRPTMPVAGDACTPAWTRQFGVADLRVVRRAASDYKVPETIDSRPNPCRATPSNGRC